MLAACSGAFELCSGRSVEELSANAVAGLFGFRFLSAAGLPRDLHAVCGYDRAGLDLAAEGRKLGLELGDIPLGRPGPIAAPRGSVSLLRDRV